MIVAYLKSGSDRRFLRALVSSRVTFERGRLVEIRHLVISKRTWSGMTLGRVLIEDSTSAIIPFLGRIFGDIAKFSPLARTELGRNKGLFSEEKLQLKVINGVEEAIRGWCRVFDVHAEFVREKYLSRCDEGYFKKLE
ncbi:hypothetical protein Trydic_g21589 [Trypoxylus dichotomus]